MPLTTQQRGNYGKLRKDFEDRYGPKHPKSVVDRNAAKLTHNSCSEVDKMGDESKKSSERKAVYMDTEVDPNPSSIGGEFGPLSTPADISSKRQKVALKQSDPRFDVHVLMMSRQQQHHFSTLKS